MQRDFHARVFTSDRWQIITADGTETRPLHVEHWPTEIYLARIELHPDYQARASAASSSAASCTRLASRTGTSPGRPTTGPRAPGRGLRRRPRAWWLAGAVHRPRPRHAVRGVVRAADALPARAPDLRDLRGALNEGHRQARRGRGAWWTAHRSCWIRWTTERQILRAPEGRRRRRTPYAATSPREPTAMHAPTACSNPAGPVLPPTPASVPRVGVTGLTVAVGVTGRTVGVGATGTVGPGALLRGSTSQAMPSSGPWSSSRSCGSLGSLFSTACASSWKAKSRQSRSGCACARPVMGPVVTRTIVVAASMVRMPMGLPFRPVIAAVVTATVWTQPGLGTRC